MHPAVPAVPPAAFVLLALAWFAAGPSPAAAQGFLAGLSLEVNGALGSPTGTFRGGVDEGARPAEVAPGLGAGLILAFPLSRHLEVYGGYSKQRFQEEREPATLRPGSPPGDPEISRLTDSGFSLGVRLSLNPATGANPWIRAGAIRHRYRTRMLDERGFGHSGPHAPGIEAGAGLWFQARQRVRVGPGVLYRAHSWDSGFGDAQRVRYLRFELTTRYRF